MIYRNLDEEAQKTALKEFANHVWKNDSWHYPVLVKWKQECDNLGFMKSQIFFTYSKHEKIVRVFPESFNIKKLIETIGLDPFEVECKFSIHMRVTYRVNTVSEMGREFFIVNQSPDYSRYDENLAKNITEKIKTKLFSLEEYFLSELELMKHPENFEDILIRYQFNIFNEKGEIR